MRSPLLCSRQDVKLTDYASFTTDYYCFSLFCCFAVRLLAVYRHFGTSLRASLLPFSSAVQSLSGTSVYSRFNWYPLQLSNTESRHFGCPERPWLLLRFTIAISCIQWYSRIKYIGRVFTVVTKMVSSQFMTLLRFGTIIFRYIDLLVRVVHLLDISILPVFEV